MIRAERISFETARQLAQQYNMVVPIEQTEQWANYQASIHEREPWGVLAVYSGDSLVAFASFIAFHTHGYTYVRSMHGPCWVTKPSEPEETAVIRALRKFIHEADSSIVFMRVATWYTTLTQPVLSTIPYDTTVIVDVTGGEEAIMSRMKRRGRRDVRKALRESPAQISDETAQALESFDEYYAVMVDTAERDGFAPAPKSDYEGMLKALGKDHCRLYVSRIDGTVSNWCMITLNDNRAVYYYGCMSSATRKLRAPDKILHYIFVDLGAQGITELDMMGIGSDFCPSLNSLTEFKTKFTEDTVRIAPDRDVPIRGLYYTMLSALKRVRALIRH